jgi:hypothetical protein
LLQHRDVRGRRHGGSRDRQGDRVTEILSQDEFGSKMEPLLVALRIKRGDKPVVAKEVMEVALDIANGAKGSKRTTSRLAK